MRVHFIAIGGSAMHNLAIALHKKGYQVTGSDDEIFEPSKSRLDSYQLLPEQWGWYPGKITSQLDAIILGMHARKDNPELLRALELGLKVYSYPEYLYMQTQNKTRVVIGGSHGKTTVTSMVMHAIKTSGITFDFMVGAQLEGFETMVSLSKDTTIAVFEGDEYLSSPIDERPKFLWYQPHIAVITGIAWDHINVFPTFEEYVIQFERFAHSIQDAGTLIYYMEDPEIRQIATREEGRLIQIPYQAISHETSQGITRIHWEGQSYEMKVFGRHNLENIQAAMQVCLQLGLTPDQFLHSMQTFTGASRRLQTLRETAGTTVFFDFAHSPSKLKATTTAVKEQFGNRKLVACMELHTFSSLNKAFLPQYRMTMEKADLAYVYYNPQVIQHKKLEGFTPEEVSLAFQHPNLKVMTHSNQLFEELGSINWQDTNLLIMTSGNFNGTDMKRFAENLNC